MRSDATDSTAARLARDKVPPMADDAELIRRYSEHGADDAFRELVQRYAGLVYSTALRMLHGDAHRAQDVMQDVFVLLARRARSLRRHPALAGWLHRAAHFKAAESIRAERRRQKREEESQAMTEPFSTPDQSDSDRMRQTIDSALHDLGAPDREVVLLRYFQGESYAAIATRHGSGESAARKRVDRALERLRRALIRRGVNSTAGAIGGVLAAEAAVPVPGGSIAAAGTAALAAGPGGFWAPFATASISLMSTGNKIAATALAVSLIANLILIGNLAGSDRLIAQVESASVDTPAPEAPAPVQRSDEGGLLGLTSAAWSDLVRLELPARIARLREIGFPADAIREYALQEIRTKYAAQYRTMMGGNEPLPAYWTREASLPHLFTSRELLLKLPEFFRDMLAELKALIGDDAWLAIVEEERNQARLAFGDLPHGKMLALTVANLEFQTERVRLPPGPDAAARHQDIARREREFKAQVLTPEELQQSALETAADLRVNLAGFNPSEQEFRTLLPLQRSFEMEYGPPMAGWTPAARERWLAGRSLLLEKVSAALGPERAAEFSLATEPDGEAGSMTRVVARLGLPFSTAVRLRQLQLEVQKEAVAARIRGPNERFPEVNQRVAQILERFEDEATQLLGGTEAFSSYRDSAGRWMRRSFEPIGTVATETQRKFFP